MKQIRVVVAEDNLLVREGLLSLLSTFPTIEVLATCASFADVLVAVDSHEPDVVLTDIRMPPDHAEEGIAVARHLRKAHPTIGVVVLSAFADPAYALALFREGTRGRGYLLKDRVDEPHRLVEAIKAVANGGSFIDDLIVDALIRGRAMQAPIDKLTRRQFDVLSELATGRNNAAIAENLCVSAHAIEKHTSAIFATLGLRSEDEVNRRVKAVLLFLAGRTTDHVRNG